MSSDEQINDLVNNIENINGALEEFVDSLKASGKSSDNTTKSSNKQNESAVKNASSFDALNDVMRDTRDEQEAYSKTVQAGIVAWDGAMSTVQDAAQVLMTMTNDLLGGEGFGMFKSMIDPIADVMESLGAVAGDLIGGFFKLGSDMPVFGAVLESAGEMAGAAGEALGKVAAAAFKFIANLTLDATQQLWDMFEGAASSGLLVTNGLHEMKTQMTSLNLTTAEYTSLIKGQAESMTIFGGSVAEGAKKLAAVADASADHNRELRGLGISYQEQAEQTSEFMESLARSGQLRLLNEQQLAEASFGYMKNLRVVSALTGKSAEDMKKDRDAALQNMAFQAKLAKMEPAVRTEMEAALGAMPEGMQQAFKESVIFGKVMTDTGAIVSGSAKYIENFANSVANGTANFDDAFQTFRSDMKEAAPELRKNLEGLSAAGMAELLNQGNAVTGSIAESAKALYNVLANVEAGTAFDVENAKNAGKTAGESVKNIVALMDTQRLLMQTILDEAESRLPQTSALLLTVTKGVKSMFDEIEKQAQPGGAIDNVQTSITDAMAGVIKTFDVVTTAVSETMAVGMQAFEDISGIINDIQNSSAYKAFFNSRDGDNAPLNTDEGGGYGHGTGPQANMSLGEKLHNSKIANQSNFGPAEPQQPRGTVLVEAEMERLRDRLSRSIEMNKKGVDSGKRDAQVLDGKTVDYAMLLEALEKMSTAQLVALDKQTKESTKGRNATEWVAREVRAGQ